jgi:crotonobetainyl-CoA:carnitine CoA-transferase CaiB-like acyl-CoA transferase
MRDVFSDPHFAARENITRVSDPELGEIRMQNVVPALSRTPGQINHAGPELGAHTDEVLTSWLDLSAEDLSVLRATGAI